MEKDVNAGTSGLCGQLKDEFLARVSLKWDSLDLLLIISHFTTLPIHEVKCSKVI